GIEDRSKTGVRAGVNDEAGRCAKREVASLVSDEIVKDKKIGTVGATINRRGNAGNFEFQNVAAATLGGVLQSDARAKPAHVARPAPKGIFVSVPVHAERPKGPP